MTIDGGVRGEQGVGLYLDLMKRVLTNVVYGDGAYARFQAAADPGDRDVGFPAEGLGARLLAHDAASRQTGRDWPAQAHTMVGRVRLDNVHECLDRIRADGVPGDLAETGVWRGGVCIFMRAFLAAHGITDRTVWLADSFEGLPPPGDRDTGPDGERIPDFAPANEAVLAVGLAEVRENFRRYDLLDDRVRFLPGWFSETLPDAPIERLALLRLDGDWYDSTMDALVNLYPRLSPGGFAVIDDYFLPGCRRAVTDYRAEHGIEEEIVDIDGMGAYWRRAS